MQKGIDFSLARREFSGFSSAAVRAGADQVAVPEHSVINQSSAASVSAPPLPITLLFHSVLFSLLLFSVLPSPQHHPSKHFCFLLCFFPYLKSAGFQAHIGTLTPTCPYRLRHVSPHIDTHTHTACARAADTEGFVVNSTHT